MQNQLDTQPEMFNNRTQHRAFPKKVYLFLTLLIVNVKYLGKVEKLSVPIFLIGQPCLLLFYSFIDSESTLVFIRLSCRIVTLSYNLIKRG